VKLVIAATLLSLGLTPLAAQVGSLPEKSPYHDFTYRQDLSVYTGYFGGNTGEAGVGPGSGSLLGVRYGLHIGGPAEASFRVARLFSDREVLNPEASGAARNLGRTSEPLWLADAGINLALTGRKSFHHLVPIIGFGAGFASSGTDPDAGGYTFGTSFAIHFGGGLRFVTHGPWGARVDVTDYLWQLSYPGGYFLTPTGGDTPVLSRDQAQNEWTHNGVITLGLTYIFAR
jgi:hypothetical protein